MAAPFLKSLWLGLATWVILYISDFLLTLYCAWLYRTGANKKVVIEGSYEINPLFQEDVDALRYASPRFVFMLVLTTLFLVFSWYVNNASQPQVYEFVMGAMVSSELAVHIRHLRNLSMFRSSIRTDGVRGRIEYSRPVLLRASAVEFLAFAGLFLVLFAFTGSVFVLGGFFACMAMGWNNAMLARKAAKSPSAERPA